MFQDVVRAHVAVGGRIQSPIPGARRYHQETQSRRRVRSSDGVFLIGLTVRPALASQCWTVPSDGEAGRRITMIEGMF